MPSCRDRHFGALQLKRGARLVDVAAYPRHAGEVEITLRTVQAVAGILLSGGSSRRMGFDKGSILVDGVPCAIRVAMVLEAVTIDAVEVGPGISGLRVVPERARGDGPLAALSSGAEALRIESGERPALVVACDLPLLTEEALRALAEWPGTGSVVPVVDGRPQPLCARWSAADLASAAELVDSGLRSMRALLARPGVLLADQATWPGLDPEVFSDVDTPGDLDRLGLRWQRPGPGRFRPAPKGPATDLPIR
jgi:molybdenum cofactor guanylyltransferase